jgi:hypothetical protein
MRLLGLIRSTLAPFASNEESYTNQFSIFADPSSIKVENCDEHFEQRSPDSADVWYGESLLNV